LKPIKKKLGLPKKKDVDIPKVPLDNLSMGTRSKIEDFLVALP
jgi:hypothetical protein